MSYSSDKIEKDANIFESNGITTVGFDKKKNKYFVNSANVMHRTDKEQLINILEKLRLLNTQEIRDYYRETRRSGKEKHNRGAGLGFIEMAKNSSLPLEYKITDINDEHSFFEIKAFI